MSMPKKITKPKKLEKVDELFLEKLNETIKNSTNYFENYEYNRAKAEVEQFFWSVFCDYYLEIVKWRVYNGNKEEKESAFYTLYYSLLNILKLLAPIMPFITEELYQLYFKVNEKEKSIHISEWPQAIKLPKRKPLIKRAEKNKGNRNDWIFLTNVIKDVRQEKTKAQKSMKAEINLTLTRIQYTELEDVLEDLKRVVNAKEIKKDADFKVEFI